MKVTDVLGLFGGLALFLYGMQMTSSGLEVAAGSRMKKILERLTTNRFLGVLVGAGVTALIQSSSAVTVMVVGFVNSKLMSLQQAVWIIMGANIGTTITGQLIALDVGELAPLFAFVGVVLIVFFKAPKAHHYGQIIAGLGILFIGMETMSTSMYPLREMPEFVNLMAKFSNPVLGILVGAVFTAVIQASAASIGILQSLAMSGVITLSSAVYVLFGQNIGTCITAFLASFGTSRNAKRTTLIHFMFNVIGTTIFTVLCMFTPLVSFMESLTPDNVAAQIANMHTLFNITTTLALLPFGTLLARASMVILPDKEEEVAGEHRLRYIKPYVSGEYHLGEASIALESVKNEVFRMLCKVQSNVIAAFDAVLSDEPVDSGDIREREEYIDYLNKEILGYISNIMHNSYGVEDTEKMSAYFKITGDLERIGDHAMNIFEHKLRVDELGIGFSDEAMNEIREMQKVSIEALEKISVLDGLTDEEFSAVEKREQNIDDLTEKFRENQIERLRTGTCSGEACVLYSELLTDFERIGDHTLNIAEDLCGKTELKHV